MTRAEKWCEEFKAAPTRRGYRAVYEALWPEVTEIIHDPDMEMTSLILFPDRSRLFMVLDPVGPLPSALHMLTDCGELGYGELRAFAGHFLWGWPHTPPC